MRRALFAALLLLGVAAQAPAQISTRTAAGLYAYDVTAASYTYCALRGRNGDPFRGGLSGTASIKTTGSSTTVDEASAGTNPFANLAVGDVIQVYRRTGTTTTTDKVSITAKASAAQVTVSSAVDWSAGYPFEWWDLSCGTGAGDGWFSANDAYQINLVSDVATINATSIDLSLECRLGGSSAATIGTRTITATGVYADVMLSVVWDQCRAGTKVSGDAGAQKLSLYYSVQRLGN